MARHGLGLCERIEECEHFLPVRENKMTKQCVVSPRLGMLARVVHGITAFAVLRIMLPEEHAAWSSLGAILMTSVDAIPTHLNELMCIAHYYALTSVVECLTHRYQMHGKLFGKWLNPKYIQHHKNVGCDMKLKVPSENRDNSGEFSWWQLMLHGLLLHVLTYHYMGVAFAVSPLRNGITFAGISLCTAFLWNTLHNSMHGDEHRHTFTYGPPLVLRPHDNVRASSRVYSQN